MGENKKNKKNIGERKIKEVKKVGSNELIWKGDVKNRRKKLNEVINGKAKRTKGRILEERRIRK